MGLAMCLGAEDPSLTAFPCHLLACEKFLHFSDITFPTTDHEHRRMKENTSVKRLIYGRPSTNEWHHSYQKRVKQQWQWIPVLITHEIRVKVTMYAYAVLTEMWHSLRAEKFSQMLLMGNYPLYMEYNILCIQYEKTYEYKWLKPNFRS